MDTQTADERRLEERRDKNALSEPAPDGAERALSREAYAMLAQANLLRMRGAWPEAIEKCMAALRLSPDHPSAQSLLGDIYENQGRLDDAIQWYRMALDVQPDSPADRIKLARLLDLKARNLTTPTTPMREEEAPSELSPFPKRLSWSNRWRSTPDEMLRRFAAVAGALAVLVVLTAVILTHRSLSLGSTSKQVNAPPVVVSSDVTRATVGSQPDAAPVIADPSETTILDSLRATAALANQGCTVASVLIDPRFGRLTITVMCQPSTGEPPRRDLILRDVTSVLQAAAQQTDAQIITQFTVRCLLSSATGGSTPLIFTADAARSPLAALNPNLTLLSEDQIAAVYTNPWWAPALTR